MYNDNFLAIGWPDIRDYGWRSWDDYLYWLVEDYEEEEKEDEENK